jgi:hypothetical protein
MKNYRVTTLTRNVSNVATRNAAVINLLYKGNYVFDGFINEDGKFGRLNSCLKSSCDIFINQLKNDSFIVARNG